MVATIRAENREQPATWANEDGTSSSLESVLEGKQTSRDISLAGGWGSGKGEQPVQRRASVTCILY